MKKRTRRNYENPFRVYNKNGKNYVYDSVTGESLFNAPEELGFNGLSKFFVKYFQSLKSWREVVLFLEKHSRDNNAQQFTYPNYLEFIQDFRTEKFDGEIEDLFEEFFEDTLLVKPKGLRLKLNRA